jgi:hypothetical protein
MAVLTIHPIHVQSRGGYPVLINGLAPTDHDCIVGEIKTPAGLTQARWNLNGIMRGGSDNCNINMNMEELAELSQLVMQLGAKP